MANRFLKVLKTDALVLDRYSPERVRDLVLLGFPAVRPLEQVSLDIHDNIFGSASAILELLFPPILAEFIKQPNRHDSEAFQYTKKVAVGCFHCCPALRTAIAKEVPDLYDGPAVPGKSTLWNAAAEEGNMELLDALLSVPEYYSKVAPQTISVLAARNIISQASCAVSVAACAAHVRNQTVTHAMTLADTFYGRFKKDLAQGPKFRGPDDPYNLWCFMAITPLSHEFPIGPVLKWYSGWEQSRVKFVLKESSKLLTGSLALGHEISAAVKLLIVPPLNIHGARGNWDGFLTTAISFQKLIAGVNPARLAVRVYTADIACMIGFFKMGNMDKAKKVAALLDADIGPGVEFDYFDSVGIWTKLSSASSNMTSSSSSSSSNLKPASKPATAPMDKKQKKKASSASAGPISSSSTNAAASSSASSKPPLSVQYEPDTKPALKSKSSSSSVAVVPPSVAPPSPVAALASSLPTTGVNPIGYTQKTQARLVYVECPICFEHFPDCAIIPCGHTFCVDCIKQLAFCSICREPVTQWMRLHHYQGEADTE
jgi:hypothetical protein